MEKYVVYIHKNLLNNKVYIGQTKNIKKRWLPSSYIGSKIFYNAINKYGWENFSHSVLKENLNKEEADYWEIYYIKLYNSTTIENGYNAAAGGSKKAILFKEHNGFFGKKHSSSSLAKMKEKKQGGNNPTAKKVRCLNTNQIFPSCKEASDWCGIARQNIQRCARGGRPTAGKHPKTGEKLKWRYIADEI